MQAIAENTIRNLGKTGPVPFPSLTPYRAAIAALDASAFALQYDIKRRIGIRAKAIINGIVRV